MTKKKKGNRRGGYFSDRIAQCFQDGCPVTMVVVVVFLAMWMDVCVVVARHVVFYLRVGGKKVVGCVVTNLLHVFCGVELCMRV